MTALRIIAYNTGEIARVIRSEGEAAIYAQLPPLVNVQAPVPIDMTENPVLSELADGNNWYRYRLNGGNLTRDGVAFPIHPNSEAESDRQALSGLFDAAQNYLGVVLLDTTATAAEVRTRVNQNTQAIKGLIRIVRYVVKHLLKAV